MIRMSKVNFHCQDLLTGKSQIRKKNVFFEENSENTFFLYALKSGLNIMGDVL